MLNGIKHRVQRLERYQPDEEVSAEMVARIERAQERAELGPALELTEDQREQLRGKDLGQMILLFRKWRSERDEA